MRKLLISWCQRREYAASCWRSLHLWQSGTCPEYKTIENTYAPIADELPKKAARIAHGVGFVVAYVPLPRGAGGKELWISSTFPSLSAGGGRGTSNESFHRLPLPKCVAVQDLVAGREHVVVLTTDGEALAMGSNCFGQCGYGHDTVGSPLEMRVLSGLPRLKQVKAGLDHTLLLSTDGRAFACGWSGDGQTGVGHYDNVHRPTPVANLGEVHSLYTCADNSFALMSSGQVYAWGNNEYGQLGVASTSPQLHTAALVNLSSLDGPVKSIAPGGAFTTFLTGTGSVYYCGYGLGPETSCMVRPASLFRLRKLWDCGEGVIGKLGAGLHYAVATVDGSSWMLWGRFPGKRLTSSIYGYSAPHKFSVPRNSQVVCGATVITALYGENMPSQPISSEATGIGLN